MNRIIVVGYPKSGNTWLTRLTAELVGCPVKGFLGSDHRELAREGEDRQSDFGCFKSHHQRHELECENGPDADRIIYVVRDPRDIAVSGANYFRIMPRNPLATVLNAVPLGPRLYGSVCKMASPENYRIKHTVHAVLHGSDRLHHWCRISWKIHYVPYWESGCLFVRYEDLLASPQTECRRIAEYLGLDRNDQHITTAIGNQSFHKRKQQFAKNGDRRKAKFLRAGTAQQWRQKLSNQQQRQFNELLREDLVRFSYEAE